MAIPSRDCQQIQAVASARTYHEKTLGGKLKSTVHKAVRRKGKSAAKAGMAYAIQHVPVIGAELSTIFTRGIAAIESKYKEQKAEELGKRYKQGDEEARAAFVLAELKHLSLENFMSKIDESYQAVRSSLKSLGKPRELADCDDFVKAFRRFYAFDESKKNLVALVKIVQEFLDRLMEEVDENDRVLREGYLNPLIGGTNKYCEEHLVPCDSEWCIRKSQEKLDKMEEKARLLDTNE